MGYLHKITRTTRDNTFEGVGVGRGSQKRDKSGEGGQSTQPETQNRVQILHTAHSFFIQLMLSCSPIFKGSNKKQNKKGSKGLLLFSKSKKHPSNFNATGKYVSQKEI